MVCYLNDENWQPEYGGELVLYLNENGVETEKQPTLSPEGWSFLRVSYWSTR